MKTSDAIRTIRKPDPNRLQETRLPTEIPISPSRCPPIAENPIATAAIKNLRTLPRLRNDPEPTSARTLTSWHEDFPGRPVTSERPAPIRETLTFR